MSRFAVLFVIAASVAICGLFVFQSLAGTSLRLIFTTGFGGFISHIVANNLAVMYIGLLIISFSSLATRESQQSSIIKV